MFGGDGRVRTAPDPFGGHGLAVAPVAGGRVMVAGRAFADATYDPSDWALLRYDAGGRLDRSFGAGGVVRTDFGTGSDRALALALTPSAVVAAGEIYASSGVARYR